MLLNISNLIKNFRDILTTMNFRPSQLYFISYDYAVWPRGSNRCIKMSINTISSAGYNSVTRLTGQSKIKRIFYEF